MVIRLKRYYGDHAITKSVMEVWLDGEAEPRMVCEAREPAYVEYTETFPGASRCCLPVGRWRMKVGQSERSFILLPLHGQIVVAEVLAAQRQLMMLQVGQEPLKLKEETLARLVAVGVHVEGN